VTIAILAYYREFLDECVASVLAQSYKDFKVVVYDDCSPEDLRSVLYTFNDPRLSYVRNERNLGTFANANLALDLCDTEYINVFHADDKMFPWMVGKLCKVLNDNPTAGIAASSRMCGMGSSQVSLSKLFWGGTLFSRDELIKATNKKRRNLIVCPSLTFRKKIIDDAGIRFRPDVGPAADMMLSFEANHNGIEIYGVRMPLLETRFHDKNWTSLAGVENWNRSLKKVDDYLTDSRLNFDINGIREYMAKMDILTLSSGMSTEEDFALLISRRKYLEEEKGWRIRDSVFNDAVSIGYLNKYIASARSSGASMEQCRKKLSMLRERGVRASFTRKLKWFINHRVWVGFD
jgi:glycosyltransferase involved in cell wall biosynthesis